jgi:GT2 family glycosyltransferase
VSNHEDQFNQVNAELEQARRALGKLRAQISLPSASTPRLEALDAIQRHLSALKTHIRLLQADTQHVRRRLEGAEREAWDQKARRADATAKLKGRELLLEQIQRSAAWKIVKPIWKLMSRSERRASRASKASDLLFAFDLPKKWNTSRDVLLIKGWCFSQSGRQIAGLRAKVGKKTKLARYGFERPDIATSFRDNPMAARSGFTVEIQVPAGRSTVTLEAIEQGSHWQRFFEHPLEREPRPAGQDEEFDDEAQEDDASVNRILSLPRLSARKAFELVQSGFQKHAARAGAERPHISVLTPTHNTRPEWIAEAALSLLNQTFGGWEWCLADDGSDDRETKKLLDLLGQVSPRIRVSSSPKAGISAATNRALEMARGDAVCFLDHDDVLHPSALESMRKKLSEGYDVVYSDEDKLEDKNGELVEPFFKPAWSPEYLRGVMYVGHLLCVRRELAVRTKFDSSFDGVQDFEFMLRLSETSPRIGHIPRILYHWRKTPGSIAERTDAKPQIAALQEKAVNAHLARLKLPARATQSPLPHRLELVPLPRETHSRISIVIPSRDAPEVLGRCLKSIFEKTSHPNFEVVLIDNETTNEEALALMTRYPVRRIPFPNPFNFSRANNEGAAAAEGELLVFLNNDTEVVTADWLQHLAYYAEQSEVGAAGALLAYEDRTVQHAGVALGMRGTADHVMRRFPINVDGYAGNLACAREVSVVTAACLMIRAPLFHEMGGFNPHFFTAYQDVDLCLRLRARGLRIVLTPRALLLHHEFVSRAQSYYDTVDRMLLLDRWEEDIERGDPYYNRNLDLERGDYSRRSRE